PLIVLWGGDRTIPWRGLRAVEAGMSLLAVALMGAGVFAIPWLRRYPLSFLCLAPLLFMALRFGVREVATGVAVLAAIAIVATVHDHGPFAPLTPNESLLLLQAFMATVAVMTLCVAALVEEHRRSAAGREALVQTASRERERAREAAEARSRLAFIVEGSDDAIISETLDGTITSWNPAAERMFGYTADEAIGHHIDLIIPRDRQAEGDALLVRL